jgi:hypothetical protein
MKSEWQNVVIIDLNDISSIVFYNSDLSNGDTSNCADLYLYGGKIILLKGDEIVNQFNKDWSKFVMEEHE